MSARKKPRPNSTPTAFNPAATPRAFTYYLVTVYASPARPPRPPRSAWDRLVRLLLTRSTRRPPRRDQRRPWRICVQRSLGIATVHPTALALRLQVGTHGGAEEDADINEEDNDNAQLVPRFDGLPVPPAAPAPAPVAPAMVARRRKPTAATRWLQQGLQAVAVCGTGAVAARLVQGYSFQGSNYHDMVHSVGLKLC